MEFIAVLLLGYIAHWIYQQTQKEKSRQKWETDDYIRNFNRDPKGRLKEAVRVAVLDLSPDEIHSVVNEVVSEGVNG